MNLLLELLFIFIFLYTIIIFKFPDLDPVSSSTETSAETTGETPNYLWHKFTLFVALFSFYFVLQILGKIRGNKPINIQEIISNCYVVAVSGILGYTVFVDLQYMNNSHMKSFLESLGGDRYLYTLVIVISIIMFITAVKLVSLLFALTGTQNQCIS